MKLIIASDHAGFALKQLLINELKKRPDTSIEDGGTYTEGSCHYPEYAISASERVVNGEFDFGILLCGSGMGVSIASNKVKGSRCALAYDDEATKRARIDNNANMIAFGARYMRQEDMLRRIELFLTTPYEAGRHQVRLDLIAEYESKTQR
jgi:ribose 5-phosphate isomerase B